MESGFHPFFFGIVDIEEVIDVMAEMCRNRSSAPVDTISLNCSDEIPVKLKNMLSSGQSKWYSPNRVVEERATFVQCPSTDDIAGQEVARATRIIFGEVLCEGSELLRISE